MTPRRLLHVTTGYLRFTALTLLAGTAAFFLAGMAIAQTGNFFVVLFILTATFFLVRMEVRDKRRARQRTSGSEGSMQDGSLQNSLAQMLIYAEAAGLILAPEKPDPVVSAFWITEWTRPAQSEGGGAAEDSPLKHLGAEFVKRSKAIRPYGLQLMFITTHPTEEIIRGLDLPVSVPRWSFSTNKARPSQESSRTVSLVFVEHFYGHERRANLNMVVEAFSPLMHFERLQVIGRNAKTVMVEPQHLP